MLLSTLIIKTQVWYLLGQCKTLRISRNIPGKLMFGKKGSSCLLSADSTGGKDKLFHKLFFILKYEDQRQIFMVLVTTKTQDNSLQTQFGTHPMELSQIVQLQLKSDEETEPPECSLAIPLLPGYTVQPHKAPNCSSEVM